MTNIVIAYDKRMELHIAPGQDPDNIPKTEDKQDYQYENPYRIKFIFHRLQLLNTSYGGCRCHVIPCKQAQRQLIELAHTKDHYDFISGSASLSESQLESMTEESFSKKDDVYYCKDTFLASSLACGGVAECVNVVMGDKVDGNEFKRAIALVRPPGHHACTEKAQGFCFFNSVAVAAKHAIKSNKAKKVFIIDWDIHHGNGTQDLTYNDPNIFYLSIHRGAANKNSYYYPGTGKSNEIGEGDAIGTNLNIMLVKGGMGDTEYAIAFHALVLPILTAFDPDLILVSSGFDAACNDLIGDCNVTPNMYYHMISSLLQTKNVPIVVALEGGYNLDVLPLCMESVALALMDEKLVVNTQLSTETINDIDDVSKQLENTKITNESLMDYLPTSYDEESISPITKSAILSINKSIRAIRNCWNDASLKEIKIVKKKAVRNTRLSSSKNRLSDVSVDDLASDLRKVYLE